VTQHGRQGYQKKRIKKIVDLLRQEVPKVPEKSVFLEKKFSPCKTQETQDFCTFLKAAENSASLDTLRGLF
jgi:hypothetical protein